MGTSLKGKNLLPEYRKSPYDITEVTSLECYFLYYAYAQLRNGSYANDYIPYDLVYLNSFTPFQAPYRGTFNLH